MQSLKNSLSKDGLKYGLVVGVIVVIALLFGLLLRWSIGESGGAEEFPIIWFIMIAAVFGAAVNQPFRHEEFQHLTFGWIIIYIFWKSTVSIVFAIVLYMLFISDLIGGDMFPQFVKSTVKTGGEYENMKKFITVVDPVSYKDVAKILVWSFVAGYSEKFVPNLISQIIKDATNDGNT